MTNQAKQQQIVSGSRIAAFFDLDKTIMAKSSTLAFSKPFFRQGLIKRSTVLKSAYIQFVLMQVGLDADQMDRLRAQLAAICVGWDAERVRSIVQETLHDIVDPLVFAEATELIAEHKAAGHDVVIVSASGKEVVEPIAAMLGIQHTLSTQMVITDGRYTGEIDFYCYGENKAVAMAEWASAAGCELERCYAYSDSATDLPMLEAVGHPTAVNPDRPLRKTALQRGWPIVTFTNQVPLRPATPALSATTVAVMIGIAVAAGITWYGLHSRRVGKGKP